MDVNTNYNNFMHLGSYNSSGWNSHIASMIKNTMVSKNIPIFAVQEHWLLGKNLFKIQEYFQDYDIFSVPAFKANTHISKGRPSGGLSFIYSSTLSKSIERVLVPDSNRVQAIKVNLNNISYVLINSYFPVDKRTNDIDDLILILQDIQYILDMCNDQCKIILLGDLNADLGRDTVFVNHFKMFLHERNLQSVWSKFPCDYTYTHTRTHNGITNTCHSTIDHFCVNNDLLQECVEAFPFHSVDNLSNHSPIILKLACPENVNTAAVNSDFVGNLQSKPIWDKATAPNLDNYVNHLQQLVDNINVPVEAMTCADVHCNCPQHKIDIDNYASSVMYAISSAVECNIPHSKPNNVRAPVPGWSNYVKPFRDDSLFWHAIWVSSGRPQNNYLHDVMKNTRRKYHYAIHLVRKSESEIRKENFLQKCLNNKINDVLKNIKSGRKNKSGPAKTIDGVHGSDNISSHFKNIYSDIYNQHESTDKVKDILLDINSRITANDGVEINKISETLILNVISKLNSGKTDSTHNWSTDAIKCGDKVLASHICNLFKSYLTHGYISNLFLDCSLSPIVKDANASKTTSDNYRLIGISSIMLKILDYIILSLFSESFESINLQFGFQKNCSTTMCTWTLLETINYFTSRGSSVFVCLLDLSKAFDTIKHDILFKKLSEKIPPIFLRIVIYSYLYQKCFVKWGNSVSQEFSVSNGVRQGAVASPTFFNIYLDNLFNILRKSGLGCMVDNYYYGFLGYADDCALLSPSRVALEEMLGICEKYFKLHGIKISTNIVLKKSKTKCMAFNVTSDPAPITLYGRPLPWVPSYKHLGHFIHTDENMDFDLLQKRGEFIGNIHALRQELGNQDPHTFMSLIYIYMTSMYGSNLWNLYGPASDRLYATWNINIKNTYNLPYATHKYISQNMFSKPHIRTCLIKRFVNFYGKLKNSSKPQVSHLFNLQKSDFRSTFGKNCLYICRELGVTSIEDVCIDNLPMPYEMDINNAWRVPVLKELLSVREGFCETDFDKTDIQDMIHMLCCN